MSKREKTEMARQALFGKVSISSSHKSLQNRVSLHASRDYGQRKQIVCRLPSQQHAGIFRFRASQALSLRGRFADVGVGRTEHLSSIDDRFLKTAEHKPLPNIQKVKIENRFKEDMFCSSLPYEPPGALRCDGIDELCGNLAGEFVELCDKLPRLKEKSARYLEKEVFFESDHYLKVSNCPTIDEESEEGSHVENSDCEQYAFLGEQLTSHRSGLCDKAKTSSQEISSRPLLDNRFDSANLNLIDLESGSYEAGPGTSQTRPDNTRVAWRYLANMV